MSTEPMVIFEIRMTPADYVTLEGKAKWEGMTVAEYLVAYASGRIGRGC